MSRQSHHRVASSAALAAGLAVLVSTARGEAGVRVSWERVGEDAKLEALESPALAAPAGKARLVGLDWDSKAGHNVTRTYDRFGVEWAPVGTSAAPTPGVDGATLVEGPGDTIVAVVPHDVMVGAPAATWVLAKTAWTKHASGSTEEDRYYAAAAFDRARGVTVVFGGYGSCPTDDCRSTIEWDGASWHVVATNGPSARVNAAMSYAEGRGVVLFGGTDRSDAILDDTWVWDGKAWSEVGLAKRPPARASGAMAWDPTTGLVALFGGVDVTVADTWVLGPSGWELATADGPTPTDKVFGGEFPGVAGAAFRADPAGGLLLASSAAGEVGTWRARLARVASSGCAAGDECAAGFCVDGVCCDRACDGACDACAVAAGAKADGVCSARARGTDGAPSCGATRCDGEGDACPSTCTADDVCAPGARCLGGACTESSCSEDGLSLRTSGATRSCEPYRCTTGACLERCSSGADCAPGSVCGTDARCGPAAAPAASEGSGCATRGEGDRAGGALLLLAACALLRRRR